MYETIALGSAAVMLLTSAFIIHVSQRFMDVLLGKILPFLIGMLCLVIFFKRIGII